MELSTKIKIYLEEYLHLSNYYNSEQIQKFYEKILNGSFKRMTEDKILEYIETFIDLFQLLDFNEFEIITAINNEPSLLHADKYDLLSKYLILSKVVDKDGICCRDDIFINHPKDLRISLKLLYARIMFLINNQDVMRNSNITRRKVLKITNEEFRKIYCRNITNDELISLYPFNSEDYQNIFNWPENLHIKEKILAENNKGVHHG